MSKLAITLSVLLIIGLTVFLALHLKQAHRIESQWSGQRYEKIEDFGSSKKLSILPLVNWYAIDGRFKTEAGVAYLIKTDNHQILFDVGLNKNKETPSPLEHNMSLLGVELSNIDTLFLSHHHLDHAGGQSWVNQNSFSLGRVQRSLGDIRIYSPKAVQYPGSQTKVIPDPTIIGKGISSIGSIGRVLTLGVIHEQALAINVKHKGVVLIVGCGHQTLDKILTRFDQLFDAPLYGIVGDLHYPVPDGRLNFLGLNLQRILASGSGFWNPISEEDVMQDINLLKKRNLGLIGLGAHDTSDFVLGEFEKTFGDAYKRVLVGREIVVN